MGEYRFVEHTADIAIEVRAETFEELFRTAALALRKIVFGDSPVRSREEKSFELRAETLEELLVDFLNELNYYLLVRKWVYVDLRIREFSNAEPKYVRVQMQGEPWDAERHVIQTEIKAATFHQLEIRKAGSEYRTMIVFDT